MGRIGALVPEALRTEAQFRLLFAGQVLSLFGDRVMLVALPFAVLEAGGSIEAVGLVVTAQLVPFLVFALAGGVISDRGDRRRVLIASDVARLIVQGVGGVLLVADAASPLTLGVLAALYGTADAFFQPAFPGLLPQTVPEDEIQEANAVTAMFANVAGAYLWGWTAVGAAIEVIVLILPVALGLRTTIDAGLSRVFFSWTLHAIVYFWLMPTYIAYYTIFPRAIGGRLYSDAMARIAFILFVVVAMPIGVHHLFTDPQVGAGFKFIQSVFTALVALPTLVTSPSRSGTSGNGSWAWRPSKPSASSWRSSRSRSAADTLSGNF